MVNLPLPKDHNYTGTHRPKSGFTLVEMSIVLVIIGLIIGGLIIGQSLVRQSQLNSVVTDVQRYTSAFQNFQQKYGAFPGDMPNATNYWGTATTCPPTYASPPTGMLTCNGDGNGTVGVTNGGVSVPSEQFLAWQHLVNAQMITGSYTGAPGSAGSADHVIGVNCPASRIQGGGFAILSVGSDNGNAAYWNGSWGHEITFGSYGSNQWPWYAILTPAEAYSVDSKFDDGLPASGNISTMTQTYAGGTCVTTNVASTAQYNTPESGIHCHLLFKTGF